MATTDFKPILCGKCGGLVWSGITWAGFARLLGKDRLTIEEEIIKKISGLKTYELHRTMVSFEAVERSVNRIKWAKPDKNRVVVADHRCSLMVLFETLEDAPNYWPSVTYKHSEGVPF